MSRAARAVLLPALLAVLVVATAACGEGSGAAPRTEDVGASDDPLAVVVTTTVLGDLVRAVVGDAAPVEVLMPVGADPHGFAPSAAQGDTIRQADLVVANGLGLEEGLVDSLDAAAADGVHIFEAADHVDLLDVDGHVGDEAEDAPAEDEHAEEDGHADDGHGEQDPHIWLDPGRMAEVVRALGVELDSLDTEAAADGDWVGRGEAVAAELEALDDEIAAILADIPDDARTLVTNHEALSYFADAYDFEVAATIIPGGTTLAEPSAASLEAVVDVIEDTGVTAVFGETTDPSGLADVIAVEVGHEVQVVDLFTASLSDPDGPAATYADMMRTNATRIVEGLT